MNALKLSLGVLCFAFASIAARADEARPAPGVVSLDGTWRLAIDPANAGRDQKWWTAPLPDAKPAKVPWIIQDAFPGYHGVAWYERDFEAPANDPPGGRTLLRFWQVDYKAEVWLNGKFLGAHEGAESPFVFDVSEAIQTGAANHLAVRVVNPKNEPIDGLVLNEVPHRNKVVPYASGSAWDLGGICDSVELLLVPVARVDDVFVRANWKSGEIHIQTTLHNASEKAMEASLALVVAPAASGTTAASGTQNVTLKPGDNIVDSRLSLRDAHLWDLDDPYLYRLTATLTGRDPGAASHDLSTRFGFRDFRFENGYFRLNGRRIYPRCSHTGNCCPIGLEMPHDPDFLRRDLINQKMMRFNMLRFIAGVPKRYQLDLADDIGLLVYPEAYAGWCLADSPQMAARYDESVLGMIRRDRNHPCIAMWGLLNETSDGPVFRHAVKALPAVRAVDDSRLVVLNSGRFDHSLGMAGIDTYNLGNMPDPNITRNKTDHPIKGSGIIWQPGQVAFHPGPHGEYAALRWTAPVDGKIRLDAGFHSIAEAATTDLHVLHNGNPLFDTRINLEGKGPSAAYKGELDVKPGDTVDFACGWGNNNYGADTTALEVVIRGADGAIWDIAKDFSLKPAPPWSYGTIAPGERPKADTFAPFPSSEATLIGSLSNLGESTWQDVVDDLHPYQRVPHTAEIIHTLRTISGDGKPVWLSEYGIGSAINLPRVVRQYEQAGKADVEDAQLYRNWLDQFLADWKLYHLDEAFDRPEDFFTQSIARMAEQRLLGLNAIRSNPHVVGHSLTGTLDQGMTAEGLWTTFRELKPGTTDAVFDAWAPLRFCLFAEPRNAYRGAPVRFEAVLANEDALAPGEYPVRLQIVGPGRSRVFEQTVTLTIPARTTSAEPPMVLPVFDQTIPIDGPPGDYRFLATFEKGAAAAGEEVKFFVDARSEDMPGVEGEVVLAGNDPGLIEWLSAHKIKTRSFSMDAPTGREVILVSGAPPADAAGFYPELARRIARGSCAIFLTPSSYAKGGDSTGWLPLARKGRVSGIARWLYHADDWNKPHALFEGLPAGGLMDYGTYRELIPDVVFAEIEPPAEAVAGAINAAWGYQSGLTLGTYRLGGGRFVLNLLPIRDNLGSSPQAERLLRNMLRYAGAHAAGPLEQLPGGFDDQLKAFGY